MGCHRTLPSVKRLLQAASLAPLFLSGCATSSKIDVSRLTLAPGQQVAQATAVGRGVGMDKPAIRYWLYLPKDYHADESRRWPVVLFLHGAGERGTNLNQVAVHGPPKLVKAGREFPFILVSPQCESGERWHAEDLVQLLEVLSRQLRIDPRRWYATGLSMGGYGTWELASVYPERFAAVAPVCGGGQTIDLLLKNREELKSLGIWAFHGGRDTVVVPDESERMIRAFKAAGNTDNKLTVYPGAGHDSWTQAYTDEALYDWLLQHRR